MSSEPNITPKPVHDDEDGHAERYVGLPSDNLDPMQHMLDPFAGKQAYRTNIDDTTAEGQAILSRMLNGSDLNSDDVLGQEIGIAAAMLQPVELVNEQTGEVGWCPRVVLLLDDGSTVGFVSQGIVKSLQVLSRWNGPGPWNPPIRVKVRQLRTRRGFRTFCLDVVPSEAGTIEKGGK